MMLKKVISYKLLVISFFIMLLLTCNLSLITHNFCYAQPISSAGLINNAKQYDGTTVSYEGEVIGEVMLRGNYAWVNVNDGQNAIGIWLPRGLVKDILYAGSYKSRGDWVEVVGVFHRACAQHGGDLDIHGQSLKKTNPGRIIPERLHHGKMKLVFILLGVLGVVWILSLLKRR